MRKLLTFDQHGSDLNEVLARFTDQAPSWGGREEDVVSVQVLDPEVGPHLRGLKGEGPVVKVRVVIVYWAPQLH